ncbi:hypothetical protein WJX72_002120 [[Myrmecia] bisecta]|uniref:Uncharacterized protein n=1 Tax=[Myrmecia] bisecta TaxID=41462 RepID=A0AAW1R669_9CHLO
MDTAQDLLACRRVSHVFTTWADSSAEQLRGLGQQLKQSREHWLDRLFAHLMNSDKGGAHAAYCALQHQAQEASDLAFILSRRSQHQQILAAERKAQAAWDAVQMQRLEGIEAAMQPLQATLLAVTGDIEAALAKHGCAQLPEYAVRCHQACCWLMLLRNEALNFLTVGPSSCQQLQERSQTDLNLLNSLLALGYGYCNRAEQALRLLANTTLAPQCAPAATPAAENMGKAGGQQCKSPPRRVAGHAASATSASHTPPA